MPEYVHVYVFDTDEIIVSRKHRYVFQNIPKNNRKILGLKFPKKHQTGGSLHNNLLVTLGCVALTIATAAMQ